MKRIIAGISVFAVMAAVFTNADAELGFRSNTDGLTPAPVPVISPSSELDIDPIPQSSINSTSKGIQLHFRHYPFREILKNIHDETGIRFNLSSQIANSPINIDIEARNWKSSIRKLIADYSRVEVWTNRPKTSRIWLMGSTPQN